MTVQLHDSHNPLDLSSNETFDLLAAVELSPFDHEILEQKLLELVYGNSVPTVAG